MNQPVECQPREKRVIKRPGRIDEDSYVFDFISELRTQSKRKRSATKPKQVYDDVIMDYEEDIPKNGSQLSDYIKKLREISHPEYPTGKQVWVKIPGFCWWPGVLWELAMCSKAIYPELIEAYQKGCCLVCFYGDFSNFWSPYNNILEKTSSNAQQIRDLKQWGHKSGRAQLVEETLEQYGSGLPDPTLEARRLFQLQAHILPKKGVTLQCCDMCHEVDAVLHCSRCDRWFHPICLQPPSLSLKYVSGETWECPCCGQANQINKEQGEEEEEEKLEKMGLTPDWIIQAAAFDVFRLPKPTKEYPYIRGLLDPCTNCKIAPNIPAEVIYDKNDNGLKLENSWSGFYILLNPDYKSQVQWRFVNRAIDEVENDTVPAVLLICRNSTDTAYFQRLRPYPRVLLRRGTARFKDYDKTPIGWGIVIFCIVKNQQQIMYQRFFDSFALHGEPNMPIDKQLMQQPAFYQLLQRLKQHADQHQRDHWIQCNVCQKWRIIPYEQKLQAEHEDWSCEMLSPPFSNCDTPQRRVEMLGIRYATMKQSDDVRAEESGKSKKSKEQNKCKNDKSKQNQEQDQQSVVQSSDTPQETTCSVNQASDASQSTDLTAYRESTVAPCEDSLSFLSDKYNKIDHQILMRFAVVPIKSFFDGICEKDSEGVLTSLELARSARMAANRAYMSCLEMQMQQADVAESDTLNAWDPLVKEAAEIIAHKSAATLAEKQVVQAHKIFQEKRRNRVNYENEVMQKLQELRSLERKAELDYNNAQKAFEDFQQQEDIIHKNFP